VSCAGHAQEEYTDSFDRETICQVYSLEDQEGDVRTTLKWILDKQCVGLRTGVGSG
jgi:hypothetical protein